MAEAARRAATDPAAGTDPPLQEQHRQQGRQLRRARELPDAPADAVRRHRHATSRRSSSPARSSAAPAGSASARTARSPGSRSPSGPTSSRSRSAWRPRSSGRSSTPATSRTPTPTSTAGCTSSSATPTCRRSRPTSRSAPPRWSSPMIEEKALTADLGIADPVAELKAVSHDPTLTHLMRLRDGRRLTALDLQWAYFERAQAFVDDRYGADADEHDRRRARPLGERAGPARPRPDALRRRARLGGQAAAAGGLPRARGARLGLAQAAAGRPAVLRRTPGEGPLPPAGRPRLDEDAARRRRDPRAR